MKNGDLFIDDRVEIPEDIKNMSKEELRAEIERFEAEIREKKAQGDRCLTPVTET